MDELVLWPRLSLSRWLPLLLLALAVLGCVITVKLSRDSLDCWSQCRPDPGQE